MYTVQKFDKSIRQNLYLVNSKATCVLLISRSVYATLLTHMIRLNLNMRIYIYKNEYASLPGPPHRTPAQQLALPASATCLFNETVCLCFVYVWASFLALRCLFRSKEQLSNTQTLIHRSFSSLLISVSLRSAATMAIQLL